MICQTLFSFLGPPSYRVSYKITIVCLSVRQFGIFIRNCFLFFSDIWHGGKSFQALFSRKMYFCPNYGPKCCQEIIFQDSLKFNISGKKWMTKFIFDVEVNMAVFCKLILSFLMCVAWHVQSTQNNKSAVSLQYVRKDVSDEFDFLHTDKHKGLLQLILWF